MEDGNSAEGNSSSQVSGGSSESTIEINVKTLESQIYTFHVNKNMTVTTLKEKLVHATGLPVEQQRLIFRGKVLKDDDLLSEYHLEDGHTLHLVARQPVQAQPTSGTGSEGATQNNNGQGNNSTAGAPRNRIGQVSHSVVLGTVNFADQGEGMVADIGRLIGSVLTSFGAASPVSTGGASNTTPDMSNQIPPSAGTEGTQSSSGRTQPGSAPPPGFTMFSHPFQSLHQSLQFPPTGTLSRHMVIPDSLTTLSEFISRMELVLRIGSQSPSFTNGQDPLRSEAAPLNIRGIPTPENLGLVMERARRLLSNNAAAALSHVAGRLEREGASTDPVLRGQIQNEAMHVGSAMQHIGAMLLELGRTIMMLRMGQSPAESSVNSGPAVYVSPTGPNPIMVQPFPLQSAPMFGFSSPPFVGGVSGPFSSGDPSRNINIHIHAGSSGAPGVQVAGTRPSSGEAIPGERPNVEQTNRNGNGSAGSGLTRGLPTRTVVASIPARPAAEFDSHVLNVIYPVHVRSQQSIPTQSAPVQGSHPIMSSGEQLSAPQPSSDSDSIPTLVAQINAHVANAISGNADGQNLLSTSMQPTDALAPHSTISSEAQCGTAILPQISLETNITSTSVTHRDEQLGSACTGNALGQILSPSEQSSDASSTRRNQLVSTGPIGDDDVNGQAVNSSLAQDGGSDSVNVHVPAIGMLGSEKQQFQTEGLNFSDNVDAREDANLDEQFASSSVGDLTVCKPSDTGSNTLDNISEKTSYSVANAYTPQTSQGGEGGRPAPVGLGLGGLRPKRRGKPTKPMQKVEVSRDTSLTHQSQQPISRGQQLLHSLASQSSEMTVVNANTSSNPLSAIAGQLMDSMPLGGHGSGGQVDAASMMSHVLQSPAFNNILTGVAAQTGVGSSTDLRNMLQQLTQSPGIRSTLNEMVQQVEGQNQDLGGMLSGLGSGQGGIDFSRMIQQMMPVVSQALGSGSTRSTPISSVQPECLAQSTDGRSSGFDMSPERDSRVDLHQAVERIEQQDSPRDIFRAVLESAHHLYEEENNYEDLVEGLGDNMELTSEFVGMLCSDIRRRLQTGSVSEEKS